jgi:hypothetical protein
VASKTARRPGEQAVIRERGQLEKEIGQLIHKYVMIGYLCKPDGEIDPASLCVAAGTASRQIVSHILDTAGKPKKKLSFLSRWWPKKLALPDIEDQDPLDYATRLATAIWEKHWKAEAPQWQPFPDLIGVLTQIDNMVIELEKANVP